MRFTILASAVLLSACLGQSGSEVIPPIKKPDPNPTPVDPGPQPVPPGIPPQPHCPCDGLREYQHIRATVVGVESFETITNLRRYALRVDEILSDAQRGEASLRPGDHFGGYWQGELACGSQEQPVVAEGAQVLAFYRRGWQDGVLCCDYIACAGDCPEDETSDDGDPANSPLERCSSQCMTQTAEACAEHREEAVMHGDLMLVPWGDAFVVGRSEHGVATIAEADLHALTLDRDACMEALDDRYATLNPPEPQQPGADIDPAPRDPTPGPKPLPSEPPPSPMTPTPMSMPQPPASATPPPQGAPSPASPAGPPPAHPEEIRVRCQ